MFAVPYPVIAIALAVVSVYFVAKDKLPLSSPPEFPLEKAGEPSDAMLSSCPLYTDYSKVPHEPFSTGPLKLPFQRPPPGCRTFHSDAVENVIDKVTQRLVDPDLARLFENCFPNTIDTTVRWHDPSPENPRTFIVTGDINAEWIRDSHRQLSPYVSFVTQDKKLETLIKGAIATHVEFMSQFPYCNAFNPPRGSKIPPEHQDTSDRVYPRYDPRVVFEGKYELDSVASFFGLTNDYFETTGDKSVLTSQWKATAKSLVRLIRDQMIPTFDEETGRLNRPRYTFQRQTDLGTETLSLGGAGNPVNGGTSLVRSAFRPSDDATIYQFFIPANAQISVELKRAAKMLDSVDKELSDELSELHSAITVGINEHAIVEHPQFGQVYAYEVDGYGGRLFMDDANLPSLLSLPDLGFCDRNDPVYLNTRKMVLSTKGNPYYSEGPFFSGIGGPHAGITNAWPMSHMIRIRTSDDDEEIKAALELLKNSTHGLGLMHESINVYAPPSVGQFTRPWFAWANSEFAKTILDLAQRKPYLIFDSNEPLDLS